MKSICMAILGLALLVASAKAAELPAEAAMPEVRLPELPELPAEAAEAAINALDRALDRASVEFERRAEPKIVLPELAEVDRRLDEVFNVFEMIDRLLQSIFGTYDAAEGAVGPFQNWIDIGPGWSP